MRHFNKCQSCNETLYTLQSGLAGLPMQPIPQMPAVVQERVRCSPFEEALSSRSRFARGVQCGPRSLTSMPLGRRTALRDLRKASAALLAFNGIHSSTSAALQVTFVGYFYVALRRIIMKSILITDISRGRGGLHGATVPPHRRG